MSAACHYASDSRNLGLVKQGEPCLALAASCLWSLFSLPHTGIGRDFISCVLSDGRIGAGHDLVRQGALRVHATRLVERNTSTRRLVQSLSTIAGVIECPRDASRPTDCSARRTNSQYKERRLGNGACVLAYRRSHMFRSGLAYSLVQCKNLDWNPTVSSSSPWVLLVLSSWGP